MKKFFFAFIVLMLVGFCATAQTSDQWNRLYEKKLVLKKYCRGENVDGHVERDGSMKYCDWKEFIFLTDDDKLIWYVDGEKRIYKVDVEGDELNVYRVVDGPEIKWFQILTREDEDVKVWCNDAIIRYFEIEDNERYHRGSHHHDEHHHDNHHHDHHHDGDHHHHHDDDDDDDEGLLDILLDVL
ncbi:MAG: hypothetical protein MJZ66_09565 [Bacteroidales bacterium]|nr:hypothetical protein [Bacteroidales bacterium]